MGKIGYYARVLKNASFKKFFYVVNESAKRSGKGKAAVLFDILSSMRKYDAGYYDYLIFQFWNLSHEQRNTFLTRFRSKKLIMLMNDHDYAHYFDNKNEFNIKFKDYIGREFIDMATATKEDVIDYYNRKDKYFCKMLDLTCGHGAELLKKEDFASGEEFYDYVVGKGFGTLEDVVENHPDVAKLYPCSVNTCRVITMVDSKGEAHCMFCVFKMGNEGRVVDNYGLHSPVDMETGEILFPCHSGDTVEDKLYTEHPYTHVPLVGYKVPLVKEAVEMAKKAALVVPQMRYIGWDIALTPNGPVIIEGNNYCAHDFWQLPGQTPGGIGMVPKIQEVIPEFKI